nr:hypothetical protein [Tanacetum cinerariifolium]
MSDTSSAPVALPSSDYVPGPEHPPSPDYVPDPEHPPLPVEVLYVPEPKYPEYLVPSDAEAPLEDQPLHVDASPTVASPGYVVDFDPDEDPNEDLKEDHADYPADGGDGDDEHSDDDDDDADDTDDKDEEPFKDEEDDEEEEEEHLALTDSSVIPIVDLVSPAGDTKAFENYESTPTPRSPQTIIPLSQTRLRRTRKTVRLEPPMSASIEACIARHVTALTPSLLDEEDDEEEEEEHLALTDSSVIPIVDLVSPAGDTKAFKNYESTPTPRSPQTIIPFLRHVSVGHERLTDIPEADMPSQKRACLTNTTLGFKSGYGITNTWDEIDDTLMKIAPTTLEGDDRALLRARVNTLFKDRPDHRRITMLLDREAMYVVRHGKALRTGTQLTTVLGRIEILEARDPEPQEGPAEAGSSC